MEKTYRQRVNVSTSVKGVKTGDGFKVEANDDDADNAFEIATTLYNHASRVTKPTEG